MMRTTAVRVLAVYLLVVVLMPTVALGQTNLLPGQIVPCDGTTINGGTECTVCHIATVADNVLKTGIYIAVFLSAVLFAWAGFKYLTNVANSGEVSKAKEIFMNVAIGLIIILAGWLVIDTLMRTLMGSDFGPWNKIC
ncbi:hypothetical protein A3A41_01790 [Candidatus Kaiserbacteria bacterium RIFCSPLOWO2_01_FULL_54_22]|nr:MAG: hypothetical protein A3A41_01790 [Candidatus Kaiserbacteria bacterium RIFCSPLOWO2_01_FULL_54_22]